MRYSCSAACQHDLAGRMAALHRREGLGCLFERERGLDARLELAALGEFPDFCQLVAVGSTA